MRKFANVKEGESLIFCFPSHRLLIIQAPPSSLVRTMLPFPLSINFVWIRSMVLLHVQIIREASFENFLPFPGHGLL